MRRHESVAYGRRILYGVCLLFLIVAGLSAYYVTVFTSRMRDFSSLPRNEYSEMDSDDGMELPRSATRRGGLGLTQSKTKNKVKIIDDALSESSVFGNSKMLSSSSSQFDAAEDGSLSRDGIGETALDPQEELKREKKRKKQKAKEEELSRANHPTDDEFVNEFPVCPPELMEVIPCLDHEIQKRMKLKLKTTLMEHYERHCPASFLKPRCLVPPPKGYQIPIPWPESRDEVWKANVPHTFLADEKSDQHWMVVNGEKVNFPGGGTHFPQGAKKYISHIANMLGNEEGDFSLGGKIRTVFDVGCGVASFGAYLLEEKNEVVTLSLAPNDVHQNQIQFALERGIPAVLGVMGTKRLPFPSRAFDLAHCSRCRIDWGQRDGILMVELDRLLRPGGFWVWSAPPVYRDDEENRKLWEDVIQVTSAMCWTLVAREDQTAIFQKPKERNCDVSVSPLRIPRCTDDASSESSQAGFEGENGSERREGSSSRLPLSLSSSRLDSESREDSAAGGSSLRSESGSEPNVGSALAVGPDAAWEVPMSTCVYGNLEALSPAPWPARLDSRPPLRLADLGMRKSAYRANTLTWFKRVSSYYDLLEQRTASDSFPSLVIRNVMDMNSDFGGFASAHVALNRPVWVLNVLPPRSQKLSVVYDRGLLGMYHDWCESFSTYPRTFDLLHAWRVVSQVLSTKCSVDDLLLEMDRIVRPRGILIFRDTPESIARVAKRVRALRWEALVGPLDAERDEISSLGEVGEDGGEQVLIARKTLWFSAEVGSEIKESMQLGRKSND